MDGYQGGAYPSWLKNADSHSELPNPSHSPFIFLFYPPGRMLDFFCIEGIYTPCLREAFTEISVCHRAAIIKNVYMDGMYTPIPIRHESN